MWIEKFDPELFTSIVDELVTESNSDDMYYFLCRLAWTISKQYDSEERYDALLDECKMWKQNTSCFNE